MNARWLVLAVCALTACAAPESRTIAELGYPAFAAAVGSETRFVRVQGGKNGLDAWELERGEEGDHRTAMNVVPAGLEDRVLLAVGVAPIVPDPANPVAQLVVGCWPVSDADGWSFFRTGRLPRADEPPLMMWRVDAPDEDGVLRLLAKLPRRQIPAGAERLAFPILYQFRDGWIHVTWYHTIVPIPQAVPEGEGPR